MYVGELTTAKIEAQLVNVTGRALHSQPPRLQPCRAQMRPPEQPLPSMLRPLGLSLRFGHAPGPRAQNKRAVGGRAATKPRLRRLPSSPLHVTGHPDSAAGRSAHTGPGPPHRDSPFRSANPDPAGSRPA